MTARRSVLVVANDKATNAAVQRLTEWARAGLVKPFVACTDDGPDMDVGRAGVEQRPLFETLAREELDLLHVVAVVGPDIESAAYVSETAERLADQIEALKPKGMQVVEARIWSPRRDPRVDGVLSAPDGFFTPRVDANLVIIPEDRRTEATLGVPLTDPHSDAFASHIAAEVATALGMWSGMDEAPVESLGRGPIGFGQAKVHLTRSFVRVAEIPAVTLAAAANHGGTAPVPRGCYEAPYPRETLTDVRQRMVSHLDSLLFEFKPERYRRRMGFGDTLRLMGAGILSGLRYTFAMFSDVSAALRDATGRILQDAAGQDSILRVIWRGMPSDDDRTPDDPDSVIAAVRQHRALMGGVEIDQQLWSDLGTAVFSLVDGDKAPGDMAPPQLKGRNVVITDIGLIAPADIDALADEIRADASRSVPTTLLGRIGAFLRDAELRNRAEFRRLVDRARRVFDVDELPALTSTGIVTSGLVVLAMTGLFVLSRLVEVVGITALSSTGRSWAWFLVTAGYAAALAIISRAVALRFGGPSTSRKRTEPRSGTSAGDLDGEDNDTTSTKETSSSAVPDRPEESEAPPVQPPASPSSEIPRLRTIAVWSAVVGLVAGLIAAAVGAGGDAPAFGLSVALVLYAVILAVRLDRPSIRSMESFRQVRMLLFFTMIYGVFGLIGLLARDNGWYGLRRREGFGDLWWYEAGILFVILLLLMAMGIDGFRRDHRERAKVADLERGILAAFDASWRAAEAFEQFVASAGAWAGVLWRPFGSQAADEERSGHDRVLGVGKAENRAFRVTSLGATAMRARMMSGLARPGWLRKRHDVAIDAYRHLRAIEVGSDPSGILRPDQDPREVSSVEADRRAQVSGRWRFLRDMSLGNYDLELGRALVESDQAAAAEWVYRQQGTLQASELGGEPLDDFLGSVAPRSASDVSHSYFQPEALKDADRALTPGVWWPSALIAPPGDLNVKASRVCNLTDGDLAIMSVRHDLAGPYVPEDLFHQDVAEPSSDSIQPPTEDEKDREGPVL